LRAVKAFRRHPYDGYRVAVERDRAPHNIRIAVERSLPVVVAKNDHRVLAQDLSFTPQEHAPGSRLQSKPGEEITTDVDSQDPVRLLPFCCQAVEVDGVGEDVTEGSPALGADLLVFVPGENLLQGTVVFAGREGRDLLGIWHWKRLEQ